MPARPWNEAQLLGCSWGLGLEVQNFVLSTPELHITAQIVSANSDAWC